MIPTSGSKDEMLKKKLERKIFGAVTRSMARFATLPCSTEVNKPKQSDVTSNVNERTLQRNRKDDLPQQRANDTDSASWLPWKPENRL
ncbi:hypothetical protein TNCT_361141 [Trichonephila clavata]|uniref:Uncharacterized protein n=1 Tax=Trichonephila clavata TaxID=2740835 RepID=A0A8X6HE41_TRICU|nr:hypothetical protein TNCT_361141 [Trichonephila clavata]